ncbi:hypothetical protein HPB48_012174 [Haemaphysalis longicornis]|uniref:tRNA pseudouridine synthase n=1 Tax=Haemaphysalis longicornis TaxID=44386 RepID=A0A9J6GTP9_HAELO|nr:hypothetical protein HPB48_012174 [Haemaphysalis longicornis]
MGDECRVFQTARNSSYQEESVLTLDDSFEGGIQRQSSRPRTEHWTVQGAIEAALCQLRPLNSEPTLVLASRTDTGVHAVESAAHVDLRPANPVLQFQPEHLATSLNTILGRHKHDILIYKIQHNALFLYRETRWRSYRYRLAVLKPTAFRGQRITSLRQWLPLSELNRCHIVPPLDVDRAHEAMELLSGEHDFRSFKNVGRTPEEDERETVRNVSEFRLKAGRAPRLRRPAVRKPRPLGVPHQGKVLPLSAAWRSGSFGAGPASARESQQGKLAGRAARRTRLWAVPDAGAL